MCVCVCDGRRFEFAYNPYSKAVIAHGEHAMRKDAGICITFQTTAIAIGGKVLNIIKPNGTLSSRCRCGLLLSFVKILFDIFKGEKTLQSNIEVLLYL